MTRISCTLFFVFIFQVKSGKGNLRVLYESADFHGQQKDFGGLYCRVDGPGVKIYEWYHNGTRIDEVYSLKLRGFRLFNRQNLKIRRRDVDLGYQGIYQAFVSSPYGKIFCRKIKVKFKVAGSFGPSRVAETRQVIVGQPYHMTCPKHSYTSDCIYTWGRSSPFGLRHLKENRNRFVLRDGTIFFSAVQNPDILDFGGRNGGYSCIIECAGPEFYTAVISPAVKMNATYVKKSRFGPKIVTIFNDTEVLLGSEYVHVICAASGSPTPGYKWVRIQKDGNLTEVTETNDIKLGKFNHSITIHNIDISHNGTYACVATSDNKHDMVKWQLIVREKPTWLPDGKITDQRVEVFTNLSWKCKAHGDPAPSYSWFSNASQIKTERGRYEIKDGKISFSRVLKEDSGIYQCVAENSFGFIYQIASLHVEARRPVLKDSNVSVILMKGSEGVLGCHSHAIPRATYTWTKNGMSIRLVANKHYNVRDGHDLIITKVMEDHGGVYKCMAENVFGKAEQSFNVTVEDITFDVKPKNNYNITSGTSFSLYCKVKSSREVHYKWRLNGRSLELDKNHIWLDSGNRLLILNSRTSDSGRYDCVVSVTHPAKVERIASANILVNGPPDALQGFQLRKHCVNFTALLTWDLLEIYNISQTVVITEWRTRYNLEQWHRVPGTVNAIVGSTAVKNLPAWSKIQFRAITQNRNAIGQPTLPTDYQHCETPPTTPVKCPEDILVISERPGNLSIVWKALSATYFNGPEFNYIVKYRHMDEVSWNKALVHKTERKFSIPNAGTNQLWYFSLQTNNSLGLGPMCIESSSYTGQPEPGPILEIHVREIEASSVLISWLPPISEKRKIDGYQLEYGPFKAASKGRKNFRRCTDLSNNFCAVLFISGEWTKYRLLGLNPLTRYNASLKAYNSAGRGPSKPFSFLTAPLIGEKRVNPVHQRYWFIVAIAAIVFLIGLIVIITFVRNIRRSDRYPVAKRERKKGGFRYLDVYEKNSEPLVENEAPVNNKRSSYVSNGTNIDGDEESLVFSTDDKYDDNGSFLGEYDGMVSRKQYDEIFV